MNAYPLTDGVSLPLSAIQRVDEVCLRFEAAWKADQRPRVDDFLGEASGLERPALIKELIALDVFYRRRCGESPSPDEYLDRFPELDAAWLKHTLTPPDQMTTAFAGAPQGSGSGLPAELANHPRYRILRELGAGGMGVVYQAEHAVMGRSVALKVIKREYTSSPAAVERFRREIQAAGRLHHPNIVAAYDAEQAGETHFLVMEYVEGVSLDRLVAEKRHLPVHEACDYVRQAAMGLHHAHERGMVHRDVKPHNLIRGADGVVKVLDFGLASVAEAGLGRLTATSAVMGTPNYMAPEQSVDTHSADARSDVYSLGCTLYHLLTGRPPFLRPSVLLTFLAHRRETPLPVCAERPDVPVELAAVLDGMMAKSPADRFQTAADVAAALEPFTDPERLRVIADARALPKGASASQDPKRRHRRLVTGALGVLCLALLASAAVLVCIQAPPPQATTPPNGLVPSPPEEPTAPTGDRSVPAARAPAPPVAKDSAPPDAAGPDLQQEYDRSLTSGRAYARLGLWHEAMAEFCRAIRLKETDPSAWWERARVCGRQGQWNGAVEDYAKALDYTAPNVEASWLWYEYAATRLMAGDAAGCRTTCQRLLERPDPSTADGCFFVARACILTPEGSQDWERVTAIASKAVKAARTPWYLYTLAAANYRAGRFQEASDLCRESFGAFPAWHDVTLDYLVLAMACQKLDKHNEARDWLNNAEEIVDKAQKARKEESNSAPIADFAYYNDWLDYQVLRREAEAMIAGN